MKDFILFIMLLSTFVLFGLRLNIQISSARKLKEDANLRKIGIDTTLFFIPEVTPTKYFMKQLEGNMTEELKIYFHKIKIYKILFLVNILLYVFAFIFFR